MKRPAMTISGRAVSPSELRSEVKEASLAWLRDNREAKATKKRRHRALSEAEREAKAQATAAAKKKRADERDARELERLLQRVGYLSKRSAKEAEAMKRVRVRVPVASTPRFRTVCSRSLYSRLHDEVRQRKDGATKRSRVAADGYKNIVLRKHSRGFGRKTIGTREYRMGEAADLARYIMRDEGLEPEIQATFTNVIEFKGERALFSSELPVIEEKRASQIAAFWNALEILESEADADGNVFSHLILAMPHELSPEGRSEALSDFCLTLRSLQLPYVAALHKPDADGDAEEVMSRSPKDVFIKFRVPAELAERAKAYAKEEGTSLSALLRADLEALLAKADRLQPNGALGSYLSGKFEGAAKGDIESLRWLFENRLMSLRAADPKSLNALIIGAEVMAFGRLLASRGNEDDVQRFVGAMVQSSTSFQDMPHIREGMLAEAVAVLEQLAEDGNDIASIASQRIVEREPKIVADKARAYRSNARKSVPEDV